MEMLIDYDQYLDYLNSCLDPTPLEARIASFGFFAAINYDGQDMEKWGEKYKSRLRPFLTELEKCPTVKMLIGVHEYESCKGRNEACTSCEIKYVKALFRLLSHSEHFEHFEWRLSRALHLKFALFRSTAGLKGVAGGRNFTGSEWADVSIPLESFQITQMTGQFDLVWRDAKPVNNETIDDLMTEFRISKAAVTQLVAG